MLLLNQNKSQLFSEILAVFHGPEISSEICFAVCDIFGRSSEKATKLRAN